MNKEVELILKKLKIVSEEKERGLYLCDKEHSKLLLDYITNLQQENERLKKLKENASNVCMAEHRYAVDKAEEARDYKSRCEKAVEYIKINFVEDIITVKTLLNILNGDKSE